MSKKDKKRLPDENLKSLSTFSCLNDKQKELKSSIIKNPVTVCTGIAGSGKAQPLYSTIYTPDGPIKMKDVRIGQEICDANGGTTIVTGIYPQGLKDCYRITFTDNVTVDCCSEHLWKVITEKNRQNYHKDRFEILQTKEMIGSITVRDGRKNYKMPICKPIFYKKTELPLDPYLLGVLLGDGGMTASNTIISSTDQEIIDECRRLAKSYNLDLVASKETLKGKSCDYRFTGGIGNKFNYINNITGDLGVRCKSEYKFIPKSYLYSSVEDRVALLQGLMDTDGTISKDGYKITYSTSSEKLRDDLCELIRSLGGISSWSLKKTKCLDNYIIRVNLPNTISPFRLSRKAEKVKPKTKYETPRYIERIEFIGEVPQQCITVDSPDHLYITDNHVVTHNTFVSLGTALELLGNKYTKIVMVKSVVTVPEEAIGFIPGTWEEKMEPFMLSFTGNIDKIFDKKGVSNDLLKKGILEVLPIAYIRGITQDNCIVVLDECQNISLNTFKSIITRIGYDCKYVILGDIEQIDRKKREESCLSQIIDLFEDDENVGVVKFRDEDCVRNPIIKPILEKIRTIEK